MKIKHISCAFALCLSLTGCQVVNDTLSTVNKTLGSVNSVLADATISTSTQNSADNAVKNAKPTHSTKDLYNQAKPTISKYIALVACNNYSQVDAYADPDSVPPDVVSLPQAYMSHHKSGCLNVLRIEKIEKKTANAMYFQVVYASPQSEEVHRVRHIAIKQPTGEWLFNYFGY